MRTERLRILAIPGSLRTTSTNAAILRIMGTMVPGNVDYTIYDGLADLPHFSPELDTDDSPAPVRNLRLLLKEADGVLICTPEYAFGVPGALKNAIDWTVSSGEFAGKPVGLITASLSGEKAHAALLLILTAIQARVPERAVLRIPFIKTKVNAEGEVPDPAIRQSLKSVLDALLDQMKKAAASG